MKKILLLCCFFGLCFSYLEARPQSESSAPLRVGIMPDSDSIPFMLARDMGFYGQEGAAVELIVFSNPQERDAALLAGRIDGTISDLIAVSFLIAGGHDFKVTSLTDGRYGIATSAQSGIKTLTGLRGKRIGMSVNTIIQYSVDAQLAAAGVSMSEYEAVAVPRMPLRLEMLQQGQIEAASLPDPLLTAAVTQGAILLSATDENTGINGVMIFSKKTLDTRLDALKAFYRAYYRAASQINADPDAHRKFLVEKAGFPESVKNTYRFVHYRKPSLPDEKQVANVLNWLKARKLLDAEIAYADIVDPRAVSEW